MNAPVAAAALSAETASPQLRSLAELIAQIYDAAADPATWPETLRQTTEFVGGASAVMYFHDFFQPSGTFHYSSDADAHVADAYFRSCVRTNPFMPTFLTAEPGGVYAATDILPVEQLRRTRFFREWCGPQGYSDVLAAVLVKSGMYFAGVIVAVPDGREAADDEMHRRLKLLAPHFSRALAIGKAIDLHKIEAAAFADTLDGLAAGVFFVDEQARLIHANEAGRRMVAEGDVAGGAQGTLTASDRQADASLRSACARVARGEVEEGGGGIPLTGRGGGRYMAHVLPLTSGARRSAGAAYAATAAVFIRRSGLDIPSPVEAISKAYGLTPSELRALYAIVAAPSVKDASELLGLSQATVKTHLQRVFDKTGARKQADLVKLVAGYMSPINA